MKRVLITRTAFECRDSLMVATSVDFPFLVDTLMTLAQQQRPSSESKTHGILAWDVHCLVAPTRLLGGACLDTPGR